jgi:hypothetical protein
VGFLRLTPSTYKVRRRVVEFWRNYFSEEH